MNDIEKDKPPPILGRRGSLGKLQPVQDVRCIARGDYSAGTERALLAAGLD